MAIFGFTYLGTSKAQDFTEDGYTIDFTVSITQGPHRPRPRSVIKSPEIQYKDKSLFFNTPHEAFHLIIKDGEFSVYETYILEDTAFIKLPSNLSGEYTIELNTVGDYSYIGNIVIK